MSIRQRIALLIILAFLALSFIGGFAVWRSKGSASDVRSVTEGVVPSAIQSVELLGELKDVQIATLAMVAATDAASIEQTLAELARRKTALEASLNAQLAKADSVAQKGLIEQAREGLHLYFEAIDQTAEFKRQGQKELAEATLAANVDQYLREQGEIMGTLQVEKSRSKDDAITSLNANLGGTTVTLGIVTLVSVIGLCAIGLVLYRQVVHPIAEMEQRMTRIATSQDFSQRMPVARNDEVGRSVVAFNTMIGKIQESAELVRQKSADIHAMLHSVPQGILTIEAGATVHPEFSEHLKTILERDDIAGQRVMDLLFSGADIGDDARSQVDAAISACIGEDEMNFSFNAHLLPLEILLALPSGNTKVLDLNWSPITDAAGTTVRLLLCLRDVTEQRALARAADAQKRELAIIGEILAVTHEKFQEFVAGSERFIDENAALIERVDGGDAAAKVEAVGLLYRNMHTVKGNARTHGLLQLTNVLHRTEQTYEGLRSGQAAWDGALLRRELEEARAAVAEYARINEGKLGRKGPGRRGDPDRFALVPRDTVQALLDRLEAVPTGDADALRQARSDACEALRRFGTQRVTEVLSSVVDSLPSLARELGKTPPVATFDEKDVVVRAQIAATLRNVFMHLYRNAIDHGIETPEERERAGKSPVGRIDLGVSLTEESLRLVLRDDGRGLSLDRIRAKALEKGLIGPGEQPTATQLAQFILAPGFSTAERVTEVSGRGVGMDAVRGFVEAEGGSLALVLREGAAASPEHVGFETVISLPRRVAELALA